MDMMGKLTKTIERCSSNHKSISLSPTQRLPIFVRYLIGRNEQTESANADEDAENLCPVVFRTHIHPRKEHAYGYRPSSESGYGVTL